MCFLIIDNQKYPYFDTMLKKGTRNVMVSTNLTLDSVHIVDKNFLATFLINAIHVNDMDPQ